MVLLYLLSTCIPDMVTDDCSPLNCAKESSTIASIQQQQEALHSCENIIISTPDEHDQYEQTKSAAMPLSHGTGGGASSPLSCTINLANTVIGAGMLGLPGAYAGCGYYTGTLLLFLAGFFSANGLRLLALSAETVHTKTCRDGRDSADHVHVHVQYEPVIDIQAVGDDATLTIEFTRASMEDGIESEEHTTSGIPVGKASVTMSSDTQESSFYTVANAAVPEFTMLIDLAVALKCFGVACGYFITVGDSMVDSFEYLIANTSFFGGLTEEMQSMLITRQYWITLGLVFTAPISFFPTLDALKFASTLSLCLIMLLMVGIVLYAEGVLNPCDNVDVSGIDGGLNNVTSMARFETIACAGETENVTDFKDTVKYLSIFVFSFTCHQNIFSVFNEIRDRTQARVDFAISGAIALAAVMYLIVAIEGYRTYGASVSSDILRSYPKSLIVTIMRMAIAAMVILSYPLQLNPSRRCITSLIRSLGKYYSKRKEAKRQVNVDHCILENMDNHSEDVTDTRDEDSALLDSFSDYFLFVSITCIFLLLSYIVAMLVEDLGIVLSVVGATGSTMVSYILPGIIYVRLHPSFHFRKCLAYLQFTLGCIIVPVALYFVFRYHVAGA